jgi:hypothetical protein
MKRGIRMISRRDNQVLDFMSSIKNINNDHHDYATV